MIYRNDTPTALFETPAPAGKGQIVYHGIPVEFRSIASRPDWTRLEIDAHEASDADFEALNEWRLSPFGDSPLHQMFGYPTPVRVVKAGANAGQAFWGCSTFPKCRTILPIST